MDIVGSLRGKRIFITGATGFLGKVLVEKLLWSVPDVAKLLLLVRPSDTAQAAERIRAELLDSPLMARLRALHGQSWEAWAAGKLEVVSGDLSRERLGLDGERYAALCLEVDSVVAGAATVRFDERLDRALELNARGALRTLKLARDAGDVPLLHVSTCYVSGCRRGTISEEIADSELLRPARLDAALAELEAACRRARAGAGDGPSEADGLEARLVEAGAQLARRHGFNDVYTLTKSLGERLVARDRGAVPLAIVRPAIVESAAVEPIPGWIDAVRVADPLLVALGRGLTRQIPGSPDAGIELIPVDHVVNCMLAALAELSPREPGARIYQVGSGRNPITLGELVTYARDGFSASPLRDADEEPIPVESPRFLEPERFRRSLEVRRRGIRWAANTLRLLRFKPSAGAVARLRRSERVLDHFLRLVDVYRPYLTEGGRYDDLATRELWARLSPADRAAFPFDIEALDWRSYISETHVPGLVRFALRAESGAPPPPTRRAPRSERQVLAESRANEATNLFDLLAASARESPGAIALQTFRDGRWLRYTYAQALTATANLAQTLSDSYGIEHGDRVVLWAGGSPEWVLAMFALHRLGAVSVPLDPQWPAEEVERAAELVEAKLICAAPAPASTAGRANRPVVELAEPFVPAPHVGRLPATRTRPPRAVESDPATIVFTSGTTVAPKAVPLTHGNFLANVRALVPLMDLSGDRLLSVLPIHHVFELVVGLLVPLTGGSTISYVAEVKPAEISWMMKTTRPTVLVAVPRLLELLHNGIRQSVAAGGPALGLLFSALFGLSRLSGGRHGHRLFGKVHRRFGGALRRIVTGGSALEPELGRSFRLMGFEVAEGYGMTETSPVLTVNPWGEARFGSVGRPLAGVELEIRRTGSAQGSGEIWVRGPNVMSGYLDNPAATAEVMTNGWLNTGDLGELDAEGYLRISGRSKEVVVTAAGKNVYPEEVERRYRDLPGVEELVVLGLADPARGGAGELVAAVAVPRTGATPAEIEEIRTAVAARSAKVPSYQQITRLEIWRGGLPKTTTLKVKRGELREMILAGGHGEDPPSPAATAPERKDELSEAERWVIATLARLTRTRPDLLGPSTRLAEVGVDSLTRVELVGEIEARLGRTLDDATAAGLTRVRDLLDLAAPAERPTPELGLRPERGEIRP